MLHQFWIILMVAGVVLFFLGRITSGKKGGSNQQKNSAWLNFGSVSQKNSNVKISKKDSSSQDSGWLPLALQIVGLIFAAIAIIPVVQSF